MAIRTKAVFLIMFKQAKWFSKVVWQTQLPFQFPVYMFIITASHCVTLIYILNNLNKKCIIRTMKSITRMMLTAVTIKKKNVIIDVLINHVYTTHFMWEKSNGFKTPILFTTKTLVRYIGLYIKSFVKNIEMSSFLFHNNYTFIIAKRLYHLLLMCSPFVWPITQQLAMTVHRQPSGMLSSLGS